MSTSRAPAELREKYRTMCLVRAQNRTDNVVEANSAAETAASIAAQLLASEEGRRELQELLGDPSADVRGSAARALLPVSPDIATPVLKELSRLPGFAGLEARWALDAGRSGRSRASPSNARARTSGPRMRASLSTHDGNLVARFHSAVMSLGLAEAIRPHAKNLAAIANAYVALGLEEVAWTILDAERLVSVSPAGSATLEDLDRRYHQLVPSDAVLMDRLDLRDH